MAIGLDAALPAAPTERTAAATPASGVQIHSLSVMSNWHVWTPAASPHLQLNTRPSTVPGGHGAFEPKKLPDYDMTAWEGRGAHYLVGSKSEFEGKRVVIIGGGDSACDWVVNLLDTADSYFAGKSEDYLGRALKGKRDKVIVASDPEGVRFGLAAPGK